MKVLVTGSAGFIGSNLVLRLLRTESPIEIAGMDSFNAVEGKTPRLRRVV